MGGRAARAYWEHAGLMRLVAGLLLAPFAWLLDLQVSYATVKWACEQNTLALVRLVPLGSFGLIGLGTLLSWSCWTMLRRDAVPDGSRMEDRSYFLAVAGLALNAVFGLLILINVAPRFLLSPCE